MNTVEQGFLVPASPKVIWAYISDIQNNPRWQTDCRAVTVLNPDQRGRGMRWRHTANNGREQVIEVTAWYEAVGYEYKIVDGSNYSQNIGRIKLHETPDGTEIIWEFHYEVSGVFGGLRNALATKRTLENNIAESLWRLWEYVGSIPKDERDAWVAKSLMRDAPDVEARAQYQSRHGDVSPIPTSSQPIIEEPPISQDDTQPRPTIKPAETETPATASAEPDFLDAVPPPAEEKPISSTDFTLQDKTETAELDYLNFAGETPTPEPISDKNAAIDAFDSQAGIRTTEVMETASKLDTSESAVVRPEIETEETLPPAVDTESTPTAQADEKDIDTASVSVFELFGVQKPSETQESPTVRVTETPEDESTPSAPAVEEEKDTTPPPPPTPAPISASPKAPAEPLPSPKQVFNLEDLSRSGLRIRLRERLISVRKPKSG